VSEREQALAGEIETPAGRAGPVERGAASGAVGAPEAAAFPKIKKRRRGPYVADECGGEPPAAFLKGIHELNEGQFFEQHETLELLWRATESDVRYLYQGVLLIGVGFYHLEHGNYHGAQAKLTAGIEMLEWFAPVCQTVDVADLIARARTCLEQLRALGPERLDDFDRALIPQVRLL
jgi:predicted metal-dependent hydrolase